MNNVLPFSRSRRTATAPRDPGPVVPSPSAAGPVDLKPPNGTELLAAENYATGFFTLAQFVRIVSNGGTDQRRAGHVLEQYIKGTR